MLLQLPKGQLSIKNQDASLQLTNSARFSLQLPREEQEITLQLQSQAWQASLQLQRGLCSFPGRPGRPPYRARPGRAPSWPMWKDLLTPRDHEVFFG